MRGLRLPLILTVALTLAATGLLPLAISFFQLKTNEDALLLQVQRTHMVAASTAAARVDAYLEALIAVARSAAAHPVLSRSPRSPTAQELLAGILQARPDVAAVGIFSPAGEQVVLAQRIDMRSEIAAVREAADPRDVMVFDGRAQRWIRIRGALPEERGQLILIADAGPLGDMVQSPEIGEEALLVLASREGEVLAAGTASSEPASGGPASGDPERRLAERRTVVTLAGFPAAAVEQASSGKIASGVQKYSDPQIEELIVAHAGLASAPWFVLSRQPARIAEVAKQRMRRAQWVAALGAILLTAVLSGAAYTTVIRPLRRVIRAQRKWVGTEVGGGSEIEQLEASFELLQQRLRDSEDLGKVFLGRYQVTDHIGSGAMGSVFRGYDPKLKRPVALKTIRLTAEELDREKLLRSLLAEAAISARFHHPNIVTVYDVADQGTAGFIAMEYVDGVSLDAYLWRRVTLPAEEVIPLGAAIARALATAHEHGLVHHDVKPANVLLGFDGSIKVTDFGISQLITSAIKAQDVICGTPGYLAPECLVGEGYTPASDLFALGLVLYEALVGRNPFFGRNLRETMLNTLQLDAEPVAAAVSDVPGKLAELVMQLLAKEPSKRPADGASVAAVLEEMALERRLVWKPDVRILKELKPRDDEATRTRILPLTAAGSWLGVTPTVPQA